MEYEKKWIERILIIQSSSEKIIFFQLCSARKNSNYIVDESLFYSIFRMIFLKKKKKITNEKLFGVM